MTMQDIRRLEDETREELDRVRIFETLLSTLVSIAIYLIVIKTLDSLSVLFMIALHVS